MDLSEAMSALLDMNDRPYSDSNLRDAVAETMRRRRDNSDHGGAVFSELLRRINPDTGRPYTLRDLAELAGVSKDTIARWADHPPD